MSENDKINVLIVEPHKEPYMKEIGTDLDSLQAEVDGLIQVIYPYEDLVGIVCNEEGKINGMELNRAIYSEDNDIIDIIAGKFMVVGLDEDRFGSLTPEQQEKFADMFATPESFLLIDDSITVIREKPSVKQKMKEQTPVDKDSVPKNKSRDNTEL